ncbi:DNA-processing protein DprA [Microcella sp.]|uniref:DNA-processing protein DprA n=1 Tax=Microcella sp. TaxID=1913979 RepID=UPI00299F6DF8|nr:DNA-processing protein DprA [Microcella sp.]MDX2025745.1 DNA-processing protein DprA [Microcella sp.]
MSRWGIDDNRIAAALAAVRPEGTAEFAAELDHDDLVDDEPRVLDDLFARAIWSVLVEPGDSTAGALIAAVGPVTAARLVIDRAPAQAISDATRGEVSVDAAASGTARWIERLRATDVMRSLESAARCHAIMVVPGDNEWPEGLDALGDSPPVLLWARGDTGLMRRPGVAIVGARAATGYGEHVAMEFAAGLCARDVVVVSGGAYGIDGMAHRAALASGGATIAVLAGGIDRIYPSGHEALLTRVAEHGLLLSEVPCGTAPTKWRFLQRNRLIAALAAATVVVEAGRRSGSLNTAGHAITMGRPVGIVPGPITSAASAGCHETLRTEPVECVTSVAEVMQLAFGADGVLELPDPLDPGPSDGEGSEAPPIEVALVVDPLQVRVMDALRPRRGQTPVEVARSVGEAAERIRGVLGVLELEGHALVGADGLWRRATRVSKPARDGETAAPRE